MNYRREKSVPVIVTRCPDYNPRSVRLAVRKLFDAHAYFRDFIRPRDRVLLKVNMLSPKSPVSATTTHPEVVRAVAKLVNDSGGQAVIGDSWGAPFRVDLLKVGYWRCGYKAIADEGLAELNRDTSSMWAKNSSGRLMRGFELCSLVDRVDKIIALPKVKTHRLVTLTCASKILFGLIPGTKKIGYHAKLPNVQDFSQMLVDLNELVRVRCPTLFLADGIVAMEGEGPAWGTPRQVGSLMLSDNPYRLDIEVCELIGLNPDSVPMLRLAKRSKLLVSPYCSPIIVGHKPDCLNPVIALPQGMDPNVRIPGFLRRIFKNQINPQPAMSDLCTLCGNCIKNCPVGAIEMRKLKLFFNYKKCIRCYCCDELCLHNGIKTVYHLLGRILYK